MLLLKVTRITYTSIIGFCFLTPTLVLLTGYKPGKIFLSFSFIIELVIYNFTSHSATRYLAKACLLRFGVATGWMSKAAQLEYLALSYQTQMFHVQMIELIGWKNISFSVIYVRFPSCLVYMQKGTKRAFSLHSIRYFCQDFHVNYMCSEFVASGTMLWKSYS